MAGRHAVAILNNGVGHIIYVVELVQDIATASVVGAEIDAITIPLNEILLGDQGRRRQRAVPGRLRPHLRGPVPLDEGPARPGRRRLARRLGWHGRQLRGEPRRRPGRRDLRHHRPLERGLLERPARQAGAKAVKATFDTAKLVKGLIKSVLQGWFGVWGGKAFERGAPGGGVHGIAERAAGGVILGELQQMKACYTVGDTIIGAAADHIAKQLTELNQAATIALGGKDPFITARDAAVEGLGHVEQRIGDLAADAGAGDDGDREGRRRSRPGATETSGPGQRASQVPNIQIPEADIGDDPLSDLAEGALNMAGEVAGAGLQLLVDQLNAGVDELKSMLTPPVDTIKEHATDLGEFMQVVTNEAKEQITSTRRGWPTSRRSSRSATRSRTS